jgi:hypothetical protein
VTILGFSDANVTNAMNRKGIIRFGFCITAGVNFEDFKSSVIINQKTPSLKIKVREFSNY